MPFMTASKELMPSSYHAHFGEPKLRGAHNLKVQIPIKAIIGYQLFELNIMFEKTCSMITFVSNILHLTHQHLNFL